MNSVLASLQKELYTHAETLNTLSQGLNSVEEGKTECIKSAGSSGISCAGLSDLHKIPASRISDLILKKNAKRSLANILKDKINNSRYVSL